MGVSEGVGSKAGANTAPVPPKTDSRPTFDQLYLARRLSPDHPLTPAAVQRLNTRYGVQATLDAMRVMRGFPPEIAIRSPYAYLEGILKEQNR